MIHRTTQMQPGHSHYVCTMEPPGVELGTTTMTYERLHAVRHGSPNLVIGYSWVVSRFAKPKNFTTKYSFYLKLKMALYIKAPKRGFTVIKFSVKILNTNIAFGLWIDFSCNHKYYILQLNISNFLQNFSLFLKLSKYVHHYEESVEIVYKI